MNVRSVGLSGRGAPLSPVTGHLRSRYRESVVSPYQQSTTHPPENTGLPAPGRRGRNLFIMHVLGQPISPWRRRPAGLRAPRSTSSSIASRRGVSGTGAAEPSGRSSWSRPSSSGRPWTSGDCPTTWRRTGLRHRGTGPGATWSRWGPLGGIPRRSCQGACFTSGVRLVRQFPDSRNGEPAPATACAAQSRGALG